MLHSSMINCPLCSDPVKMRDLHHHQREECEQRLIFCLYSDCCLGRFPRSLDNLLVKKESTFNDEPEPVIDATRLITLASLSIMPSVASDSKADTALAMQSAVGSAVLDAKTVTQSKPQLPAHRLLHHLQFECSSIKRRNL
jgi:hypothetical protein